VVFFCLVAFTIGYDWPLNLQPSNADVKYDAMWCFGASTTVEMNQRENDVILSHVAVTTIGKEVPY
jgi:hypothetical protein